MSRTRGAFTLAFALLAGVAIVASACGAFSASPVAPPNGGASDAGDANEAGADVSALSPTSDGGPIEGGMSCGRKTCAPSEVCCWLDPNDAGALQCTTASECTNTPMALAFLCKSDEDCVARHCCATQNNFTLVTGGTCFPGSCNLPWVNLCNFGDPTDLRCVDVGLTCDPATAPLGFAYCR